MYPFIKPSLRLQQFLRVHGRYLFAASGEPAVAPVPTVVNHKLPATIREVTIIARHSSKSFPKIVFVFWENLLHDFGQL